MKERPILFSAPMVRAILAGTKVQTRRVCKPAPVADARFVGGHYIPCKRMGAGAISVQAPYVGIACPYGQPGDRLWVRETHYAWGHWTKRQNQAKRREEWHFVDETVGAGKAYRYDADEKLPRRKRELHEVGWWKRPAIFMPRVAVRISLEITGVRVERLQAISRGDAMDEGCPFPNMAGGDDPRVWFEDLWRQINGPASWDANPWVWVVEFKRTGAAA
jgi:hypothetical protein